MASTSRGSPDDDGYKRFTEDIHNVSYGSNKSDPLDEMGSRSSLSRDDIGDMDQWEMNFHEAAIFLEEGANNEKFDSHPRHPAALPAYLLVHNSWYYGFDLLFSLILLLLALVEKPSLDNFEFPVGIHSILELVALGGIGVELMLKLRWIGWRTILKHKRTMVKCVTLSIMVLEAITVLVRQSSHFRVTRALRPIFLVDTRACGGVRRYIRQILQSLPPIIDMLGLLMFFVCSYALLGYFLFSGHDSNLYFKTLEDSFVSMFVLLTTANFPDVMMPSYAISKWTAAFFISYISTVLYVLMNLMLAVVYETFTGIEKDKFRKLLLHKRQACKLAFRLLVSKQTPNHIRFKQFHGLMRYYSPKTRFRDVVLMFRQLNKSNTGQLTQEEFLDVYDSLTLKWRNKTPLDPWFSAAWPPLRTFCRAAKSLVTWRFFEHIIYILIIANGIAMFIRIMESSDSLEEGAKLFCGSWDTYLFLILFLVESILKIIGLGWSEYISSGWNIFDLSVTLLAFFGAVLLSMIPSLTVVVILRPLRLLRLFKLKKRYRDIFGTLVLLSPLMWSTGIVMMVMYYFFAIIGMELFSPYHLKNCCVNTTVEDFYKSNGTSSGIGYYYLNNFSNLLISGVTLFELTVVNNWFIVMDAYASVSSKFSRLYFMLFYLFTMVVLTIVVASVLEAFRFRIQYKQQTSKKDEELMLHEEVIVDWNSLQTQVQEVRLLESLQTDFVVGGVVAYIGRRRRTREVLQRHMYATEIKQWLEEAENEERNDINMIIEEAQINARLISA
ncbi:two pore calcium channel protein 1-like isoform X1 [Diorhabda sublineata]|uniref:two pore calcium channel protein 1-like isoform X1 n=2 Tax=Diorhabda sublineata TaxID=1163346 RepID=UPI0024E18981|nr:two pore calcium channel protein 1-like isoform X1 [Diorhabda sublineata]